MRSQQPTLMTYAEEEELEAAIADIQNRFTYHPPMGDQPERYEAIREHARNLAEYVVEHCPDSQERSAGLTLLQQATMMLNASIACNERGFDPENLPKPKPAA